MGLERSQWITDNPRVAYNGNLVNAEVSGAAFEAVCELRGITPDGGDDPDENFLETYENSPEGLTLAREVRTAIHAALTAFANDPMVKDGEFTLDEFLEFLRHQNGGA